MTVSNRAKFALYVTVHPFKGFWDMKYEGSGRMSAALAAVLLLALATIVKQQFAGFIVNRNHVEELNSLNQLYYIVLPFLLWCIANWSTTTLMDGEGTFADIVMATGYALIPLTVVYVPQTLFSHWITEQESAFYYFLDALAVAWSGWLLFIGTMTVHQYSVGKTIVTMLLTLLVIGMILFIGLLFFSLIQQMVAFVATIHKEIALRP
ncbi:Yip1 family protein [Paenibacillus hodogayensis]|uniref:Yip1 family protein n=1 Tax=Paenibacillus hodogayensis TaxID=279208 RepID=A0ABV5VXT7_9BACL